MRRLQVVGMLLLTLTLTLTLTLAGVATAFDFWMYPKHMEVAIDIVSKMIKRVGGQFLKYFR